MVRRTACPHRIPVVAFLGEGDVGLVCETYLPLVGELWLQGDRNLGVGDRNGPGPTAI